MTICVLVREVENEQEVKNFVGETELRTRLITDLTQLIRFCPGKTELHVTAIEILTELVESNSCFRKAVGDTGAELGDEVLRQLGVNVAHSSLLLSMIRESTSLQVSRDTRTNFHRSHVPVDSLEILAANTAEDPNFLACLLNFLICVHKNSDREDLNNQEAGRFWGGVRTALMNMLQLPVDGHCYIYRVPVTITATQLLLLLSVKQSVEQDVTNVDAIISRLDFELIGLKSDERSIFYPTAASSGATSDLRLMCRLDCPRLDHRQELCRSLVKLISSSINQNMPRNPSLALDIAEDEQEDDDSMHANDLRRRPRQGLEEISRSFLPHSSSSRRRGMARALQEQGRLPREINVFSGPPEPEEEDKDEEVPHEESVAVSRRVLESKLMATLRGVLSALVSGTPAKLGIAYEPVVYSVLWLVTSVVRDIPASIPEMVRSGVIPAALMYLSSNIAPGPNYFYIILSALNAFTLHEEGTEQVSQHKIIDKLFHTLLIPVYGPFLAGKETGHEGMEDSARLLLSLYTQAKPNIKSSIVHDLRKCLDELKVKGQKTVTELGSAMKLKQTEKASGKAESPAIQKGREKAWEQCKEYGKALRNMLDLLFALVQNVGSREHAKFLSSLNEGNEVLKNVLIISKLEAVLAGALDNSEAALKYEGSRSSHILKFYLGEIGRLEFSGGVNPEIVVLEMVMNTVKNIQALFGLAGKEEVSLGDFVTEKRVLRAGPSDELIVEFPKDEKIVIALNIVEWICKTVKLFGRKFPAGGDKTLQFISDFHLLLIREIIRLYTLHAATTDTEKEARKVLSQLRKSIEDGEDSVVSEQLNNLLFSEPKSRYEKRLCFVYNKVSHVLSDLARSTLRKIRRYEYDPRENRFELLQPIGRCAGKFTAEALSNPAVQLGKVVLGKDKSVENEARVLHNILLVKDMQRVLMNDVLSVVQLFEFFKSGGFEQLQELYQSTVNLIIAGKSLNTVLTDELNILATYIVKTYTTIMSPTQLKMLSFRQTLPSPTAKAEMVSQGFKTTEDFVASVLAYAFESLMFQTKYEEYKTAVRFLAECVPLGFKIFLDIIRKYPNKDTLAHLLQESSSGAGPEAAYEEFVLRRMQREREQQQVPASMVEHLMGMGFDQTEAEDALRRNDLDVDKSIMDIISRRDEMMKAQEIMMTSPAPIPRPKAGIRKLEAKGIHKEVEGWLDYLLASLYEALYSVSTFKCKYLLYSLSEFQSLSRPYKVRHAFALLLNELQTLLFSLELSYGFEPIANAEFPVTDLAEASITGKLRKKIKKYAGGIEEEKIIVLHKMSALIDVITTFLRLSKSNELLRIMCENKIAQCLIVVLSKLTTKEFILPGRKLIPKVLILLTMIYKEVNQTLQGRQLDQNMKSLMGESVSSPGADHKYAALLPAAEDNRKLVQLLHDLLSMDEPVTEILRSMKTKEEGKDTAVLLTTEIITAIVLLLCHLTKDYNNSEIVTGSGILERLFTIRQVQGTRGTIPSGLLAELIFNLFESPQLLSKYMERIICSSLFAKAQWKSEKGKPQAEAEIEELRRATATDMDRFLGSMSFLVGRNAYAFLQSCQKVGVLQKEMIKEGKDKMVAKYMLTLSKACLLGLIEEECVKIPNVPVQTGKKPLTRPEAEYMSLLGRGIRESADIMKSTNANVILQLISRAIDLHFETRKDLELPKSAGQYIITETLLLEIMGQIIRIYPEALGLLLTFKNKTRVTGNNIVSFMFSALFPLQYIGLSANSEIRLQPNEEWRNKSTQVVKFLTYENPRLHHLRHRIMFTEMRKRVVAEIFRVLARDVDRRLSVRTETAVDPFVLASACSTFSILEGLLISGDNSVQFPKANQYTLLKEMVGQKHSLIRLCTHIMRKCNLHSAQTESVVISIVNVLERLTRFNRLLSSEPSPLASVQSEAGVEGLEISTEALELFDEDFCEVEASVPMEVSTGSEDEEKAEEDSGELMLEEEVKVSVPENEVPASGQGHPLHRESSVRNVEMLYGPEDSDEEDALRDSPLEHWRLRGPDVLYDQIGEDGLIRRRRRSRSRHRDNRSMELDAVQVQINTEPQDKGKSRDVRNGLADIYEREAAGETNNQIMKVIKGDVLGEENYGNTSEGRGHEVDSERVGAQMYEEFSMGRLREAEEEEKREELPAVSLFGYTLDKQKVGELLKNQLMGTMPIHEIIPEEEKKPAVPVPEPASSLSLDPLPKKPEAEEQKAEVKKESKKEEKKVAMSPSDLANLIGSLMGNTGAAVPPSAPAVSAPIQVPPVPPAVPVPVPEAKSEEKKEEHKAADNLTQALVAQRRHELALLVPNIQVEDDNLLLQIDPEFLRALTPDMRISSVQQLIAQNRPPAAAGAASPGRGNRGAAEMDPATFIATIADENLRDEILMTAAPEFLAALPPEMTARAENLRERNMFDRVARRHGGEDAKRERKPSVSDPIEGLLLIQDKGDVGETEIARAVLRQTGEVGEHSLECLIRLLYVNVKTKIPLNALMTNLCISRPKLYKLLNSLLFILSKHASYEKYFQSQLMTTTLSDCVSETKLLDVYFPPICLYRGMEFNHLTYSVVSLRIFSLLSALLCKPGVSKYFFLPSSEVSNEKFSLKSIAGLGQQISKPEEEAVKLKTPLTELLSLTGNTVYRTSEKHLETIINFVTDLFNTSEQIAKQRKEEKMSLPVISVENVKQMCKIFYFEVMSDPSCTKLVEILAKLSSVEENALAIIGEIAHILDLIGETATREWGREIKQLDQSAAASGLTKDLDKEERHADTRIEVKLGRILRLLKRLYDIHSPKGEDDSPSKILKLYVSEGDSIEEALPVQKKQESSSLTEPEVRSLKIRRSVLEMLKKDSLINTFDVLTDLVAIISKKSSGGENSSRKSQLLIRLVPAIESLIMAYDYNFKDLTETTELLNQIKQIREAKPEEKEMIGAKFRRAYVFYKFLERNHRAFNNLIRQMSQHTFQTVIKPFILRFPSLLDFENKRNYFKHEQKRIRGHDGMATLRVSVNRESIFTDSYNQLATLPVSELKGRIRVSFKNEQAADAGGVTREWYTTLSRAMFNPIIALFKKSAHGNTYQPDPKSVVEPNHLNYFKFIGRIIGKALLEGQYLECYFTRALYKTLVGQTLTIQDMQDYDAELYKGLIWVRDNDVTALDCYFTYTMDYFGQLVTKELIEGGKTLKVTNENKHLFIVKTCKAMLYDAIKPQIEALQKGLYEIIPKQLISIFDYREIELLISGLPDVDVIDLRKNTEYAGYSEKSKVIEWFWEVLESFSTKERAEFLQFVTGTSKVPLDGFKNLPGASGVQRFQVHKVYGDSERLPSAHTW